MPFIVRKTISETYLERVRTTPNVIGFQYKPTYADAGPVGVWKEVSFKSFHAECGLVSFGLMGLGVQPKDRVAILSDTRYEWALCDMAILGASAVTVPVYSSSSADDVAYILNHSEAKVAILENIRQLEKVLEKRDQLPNLKNIVVIEPQAMNRASSLKDVMTLQALKELGRREEAKEPSRFESNLASAQPEDLLTICYTSGTTGVPKGAMLTQDCFVSVVEDAVAAIAHHVRSEEETLIAFLPFSHVLGKCESLATYAFGWRECYAENLDKLTANISEVKPTIMFAVPRIFEKAYNRIIGTVETGSGTKKALFQWALDVGRRYYEAIWNGRSPSAVDYAQYKVAQTLVFSKIRARLGGRLRFAVCGGAPLPREIAEFFQIAGILILEGYGLTETSAPVTVNTPEALKFGSVGRPLQDVQVKIAEDGEILLKSRKIFKAYYKMPAESAEVLKDGWFYTGDIGHLDNQGFLHITDRKKDIIITSGGKNIAPQKIENLAKSLKYISQFLVHGDRRNYLTALITLDREAILHYANENQILYSEYAELIKHPKITTLIQKRVDELNSHLASYETIKKFILLPQDFSIEAGEITPSLKLKRGVINRKYKAELDSMYT